MATPSQHHRSLLVVIAILIGIIVALVAGILSTLAGAGVPGAITNGGVAFAGAVTLSLVVMRALRAL